MMQWINEGRREMATLKPEVFGQLTDVTHTTVSGCSQRLTTTNAIKLVSVDSNVASGRAIRPTTRQQLDAFRPEWRSDDNEDDAQNWFPDETDPLRFWIYPAVGASKSLKTHALVMPTDVSQVSDEVVPLPKYEQALVNYICFRALSKPDSGKSANADNVNRATAYFNLFVEAMK